MATRPVFMAGGADGGWVREALVEFRWHPGMSNSQKRNSIRSLHEAAKRTLGIENPLEVSSRSETSLGRALSAFQLEVDGVEGKARVECLFQGSKVFAGGGPYTDLYASLPAEAKRDPRIRNSGALIGFHFEGVRWPLEPKSVFYDWLYLRGLAGQTSLWPAILEHDGFTDIEFNPMRSINCQARSVALFVALRRVGRWESVTRDSDVFLAEMKAGARPGAAVSEAGQFSLI